MSGAEQLLIHPEDLDADAIYRLLSGIVVPRPIAWITTQSERGVVNLAPFSCYTFVSNWPPMIGVTIGRRAGKAKDTAKNIHALKEFVVNIGSMSQLKSIHASSAEHGPSVSETDLLGLALLPCDTVKVPRLEACSISMECRLVDVREYGQLKSEFLVGEVSAIHIAESLYVDGKIDTALLDPVCRIAGPSYARLGEIITLAPVVQTPKTP